MTHANSPLSVEGRRRLVERCQRRPISHVASEMGISRACASKWVNRWRRHGELGLQDRPSTPHSSPNTTPVEVIAQIEIWRRDRKWSAQRITYELGAQGYRINRRTVTRHLARVGLGQRRFLDSNGESNRVPGKITARWPGHMVHLDVKKVGRIPDGGGWRIHGRDNAHAKAAERAKTAGGRRGYVYLHSAIDGFSRLAYTEPLADEKGATAAGFLARAKIWFAAHGITHIDRVVTDNGACYRSGDFTRIVGCKTRHQRTKPYTPRHNGKIERYQRILAEEVLYARAFTSEDARSAAIAIWNHPLQLPPATQRLQRSTTCITAPRWRHQRPTLLHLVGPDGTSAGTAFFYEGSPSWLFVAVRAAPAGTYEVVLTTDGQSTTVATCTVETNTCSVGVTVADGSYPVDEVSLRSEDGVTLRTE